MICIVFPNPYSLAGILLLILIMPENTLFSLGEKFIAVANSANTPLDKDREEAIEQLDKAITTMNRIISNCCGSGYESLSPGQEEFYNHSMMELSYIQSNI